MLHIFVNQKESGMKLLSKIHKNTYTTIAKISPCLKKKKWAKVLNKICSLMVYVQWPEGNAIQNHSEPSPVP